MRISRLFVDQTLRSGQDIALDERSSNYLRKVLRLRRGDALVVFDGHGCDYAATLTECHRQQCRAHVGAVLADEPPPGLRLHLGIGISRGERMDLALQKSVELGVDAITPLLCEHGVVQLDGARLERRVAHWRGVIIGACEQSGRSRLPDLDTPAPPADWVQQHRCGLLLDQRSATALASMHAPGDSLALLVGPEGGLSEAERQVALDAGYTGVRLGPRILRTETAPLAALAAIQTLWGDFR